MIIHGGDGDGLNACSCSSDIMADGEHKLLVAISLIELCNSFSSIPVEK